MKADGGLWTLAVVAALCALTFAWHLFTLKWKDKP